MHFRKKKKTVLCGQKLWQTFHGVSLTFDVIAGSVLCVKKCVLKTNLPGSPSWKAFIIWWMFFFEIIDHNCTLFLSCVQQSWFLSTMRNYIFRLIKSKAHEVVTTTLGNIKVDLNQVCRPVTVLSWIADLCLPMWENIFARVSLW